MSFETSESDGPDPYVVPGFSLHTELEWLVRRGFSPMQAFQSATFNPALFLAKLDKFGVVETGHAADLVLLEANPLEDTCSRPTDPRFGAVTQFSTGANSHYNGLQLTAMKRLGHGLLALVGFRSFVS